MAYITNMGPDFTEAPLFNLTSTVGRTGKNMPGDVYLLQILFGEATKSTGYKYNFTSGVYNSELEKALQDFKRLSNDYARKSNQPSVKVYYEGHIDPARGSTRAFGTNRLWSICKLNCFIKNRGTGSGYVYSTYSMARNMIPDKRIGFGGLNAGLKLIQSSLIFDAFRRSAK
jgi:hypothetical protein